MSLFLILLFAAVALVSILIVLGSIISRKSDINFSYLSIFSLFFYLGLGYTGAVMISPVAGITLTGLVGLYEAIFGFKLMLKYNANLDNYMEDLKPMMDDKNNIHPGIVTAMVFAYLFLGWIGTLLA
jgi:hypothetical protein